MPDFTALPIPYVPIADKATEVRAAIDAARLSAANSFGGLQKLAIPGPFATDAEANTFGVPDDNLYYRSDGTVRAASHISLDLAFALDKTLTARTGPTPTFSRASSGLFVNANGILVGKTAGTTASITPSTTTIGTTQVTVTVASGSVVGWLVGQSVSLIVDSNANNAPDTGELWLVGDIVSTTATQLVFRVTSKGSTSASATAWTLGYRGARFDHDATGASKGLLIEEQRTNICLRSENFGTTWGTFNSSTSLISQVAPNGDPSAYSLVENTGPGAHSIFQSIAFAGTTNYTFSVFVKAGSRNFASLVEQSSGGAVRRTFFNLSTGEVGTKNASHTASTQQLPNGWWRLIISFTSGTAASANIAIELASADNVSSYLGNGSGNVFLWGAQLEAGSFPTSYIPTTSGTAIRGADVCSITNTSSFWSSDQFTLFGDGNFQTSSHDAYIASFLITGGFFGIRRTSANAAQGIIRSPGINADIGFGSFSTGVAKMALAYSSVGQAGSFNGGSIVSNSTAFTPSLNPELTIGAISPTTCINGHVASIRYYRKRLSNAKLQALTTP